MASDGPAPACSPSRATTSPCWPAAAPAWRQPPQEVRDLGGDALTISVDTADHEALEHAADRVEAELGAIDVWVNDAFTSVFARFVDIEPEEFRRVTEVTYLGFVNGTRTALRRMLPRDSGVIVQVGSALAHRGIPLQSAYCGAKHAMWGFHESLLHRAAPRPQQRPRHLGADARASTPRSSAGCSPSSPTRRNPCHRSTSPR